jgi:hypothetical protein
VSYLEILVIIVKRGSEKIGSQAILYKNNKATSHLVAFYFLLY